MRCLLSLLTVLCLPVTAAADRAVVERLLAAVGGADAWREATWVHTWAVNHHPQARLPYTQEGWIRLDRPAHRLHLCNFDMQRARAYTSAGGWGVSEGRLYDFDAQRLAEELAGWENILYRKLRLLAENAAATEVRVADDRVHVTHDKRYLGWIGVDPASGDIVAAGREADDSDITRFGPMTDFGAVRWMTSGRQAGGWGFETMVFELLGDDVAIAFARGADTEALCAR